MEKILSKAYQLGYDFERRHHGCGQCVIAAVYQIFPEMICEDIFRSANAQAGGLGLTSKGQCGAVTGAAMILSQIYGRNLNAMDDPDGKRFKAYRLGAEVARRFETEVGFLICCEIQNALMGRSFNLFNPDDFRAFESAGGHDNHCPHVVGSAAKIAVQLLLEQKQKKRIKGNSPGFNKTE